MALLEGTSLLSDLKKDNKYWEMRELNKDEVEILQGLLTTDESKVVQQEYLKRDVGGYIEIGRKLGITDPKALAYFCDLYNQSPKSALRIVETAGGGARLTLDKIHQTALADPAMGNYADRRENTYQKVNERIG